MIYENNSQSVLVSVSSHSEELQWPTLFFADYVIGLLKIYMSRRRYMQQMMCGMNEIVKAI